MLFRNIGIHEHELWEEKTEVVPPETDSFFFRVFEANRATAENVYHTAYLQAVQSGNLPPDNYGQLTVLDSYYCYRGAETYSTALCNVDKEIETGLYELMKKLSTSYVDYNKTFFDYWHIRSSQSVNATESFVTYSEHEHHIACSEHPIYTLVAMLPCYYLWYWFSDQILKAGITEDNLYSPWVNGCHSAKSAYIIGNFIEEWKRADKEFDEIKATEIYTTSMNCELKVFTEAYPKAEREVTKK